MMIEKLPQKSEIVQNPHATFFSPNPPDKASGDMHVALQVLAGNPREVLRRSDSFSTHSPENGVTIFKSADEACIRIEEEESLHASFEDASASAYQKLFAHLKNRGNLVRIWNYIPRILEEQDGIERYKSFNVGRKRAWESFGPKTETELPMSPSATAVGSLGKNIQIQTLVSHHPVIYVQNPNQTPPAEYSEKFGPQPPLFARGALLLKPDVHEFFVSGTASIRGEESVHIGNPAEQTEEILRTIKTLISKENCARYGYDGRFDLADIQNLRVYVKNPEHLPAIQDIVQKRVSAPAIYLHNDICRPELLVEIECMCTKKNP